MEIRCGTPIITEKMNTHLLLQEKSRMWKKPKIWKIHIQALIDLVEMKKSSMKKEADENEEITDLRTMMKEYFKKIKINNFL